MTGKTTVRGLAEEHFEAIGTGLGRVEIHEFTDTRTGTRVRFEQPVHPTMPRPRMDLLRHRSVAYDRLGGDVIPTLVPQGCLGVIEPDGRHWLLAEAAQGLPRPRGERGWVYCRQGEDGRTGVFVREHAAAQPLCWGTSARSLLGLRPNNAGRTRLWRLGAHVIWLRQEHPAARTVPWCGMAEGAWPDALVEELFRAGACTVMMDDSPLPGVPTGATVLLEADAALIVGIAATADELAAFLREDHVHHYVVSVESSGEISEPSPIGDLPRTSVAHRDTGDGRAVVFIERLPERTTSYAVEDGTVIATLEEAVDHYTGVPGLNGAWVERQRPDTVLWPEGSWSDGTRVEGLVPSHQYGWVRVRTGRTRGYRQINMTMEHVDDHPDQAGDPSVSADAETSADDRDDSVSRPVQALWAPAEDDPVAGTSALFVIHSARGHEIEELASESVHGAVPLVWFDSSWTVPGLAPHLTHIDMGSLPVGSAQWCHAGLRPVLRVGIDYEALAHADSDGIMTILREAWQGALNVIDEDFPGNTGAPFLGGHSFGAALAAVAVLHELASPAGAILRSGAYDRYATPGGFEHHQRTVASAPDLYRLMTVVSQAHAHRGIPFLLTCGDSDENSATTPHQSEVFYENLALCGADATFVVYSGEGHVFTSKKSIMERRQLEQRWMSERVRKTGFMR